MEPEHWESLDYGQLPDREAFLARVAPQLEEHDGDYRIGNVRSQREWSVIATAINVGIDSHLEAIDCDADETRGDVSIHGAASLYTFLRRLADGDGIRGHECGDECANEREDGEACPFTGAWGLASSILYTLGYEWI